MNLSNCFSRPAYFFWATLVLVILASPKLALACSCTDPPPPCVAFSQASAVFIGKAVR
jgi:hypothetical protein